MAVKSNGWKPSGAPNKPGNEVGGKGVAPKPAADEACGWPNDGQPPGRVAPRPAESRAMAAASSEPVKDAGLE